MPRLLFIDDAQVVPGTDGAKPLQLAGESVIAQERVKGLIHEQDQGRFDTALITLGQPGKGFVKATRGAQNHQTPFRR